MNMPERNAFSNSIMLLEAHILSGKPLKADAMKEMADELRAGIEFYEAWICGWRGFWHDFKALPENWVCPGCKQEYRRPDKGICDHCKAIETARESETEN